MKIKNCLPAIYQRRSRWQAGKLKIKFGFTIIDLLVSMAIMTLLIVVATINFIQVERNQSLSNAAEVLASQLRTIENMAITGEGVESGGVNKVPAGGYGINFSKSGEKVSYFFFADMNRDLIYNTAVSVSEYFPDIDQKVELEKKYALPKDVIISQIQINGSPLTGEDWTGTPEVNLLFKTPQAKVYVNGDTKFHNASISWFSIVLTHNLTGKVKKIVINPFSRQISIE